MTLARALPLVLAACAVARAEEQVELKFAWPDGARWKVVDQWELEATAPDGEKKVLSGAVRALWTWEPTADGKTVVVRQPVIVRATPRDDATARAVAGALMEPWRSLVSWDEGAPAPAPTEVASTEVPPPAAPSEQPVEPAPEPAPATPVVVAPAVDPGAVGADPAAFVRGDPVSRFRRVFRALDHVTLVPGRPAFDVEGLQEGGSEVSARIDPLAYCPDVGPGSVCVQLTITRLLGGAPAEGPVPVGAFREQEIWIVEPGTLVPHAARIETFAGFEQPPGSGARQAHASHLLSFLPPEPPPALVR